MKLYRQSKSELGENVNSNLSAEARSGAAAKGQQDFINLSYYAGSSLVV